MIVEMQTDLTRYPATPPTQDLRASHDRTRAILAVA
jgi:hypothetical protein